MERSLKRIRIGPSPFDEDDADADELTFRPEELNARRDPGYQLERSRAFAAYKLKSAFERIFDKYERDFTGIGDEIDLRTGEIVVNNGHIESLKTARLGAPGDDDDESLADGSADEEERIMQGNKDRRLSRLGQNPLGPLRIQPTPPLFPAQWPATPQFMGAPPMLSSIIYPGQTQFPIPVPHGSPNLPQSIDPTWNAPELPQPTFGSGFGSPLFTPRIKARVSLITAGGESAADDEDDLLLGVSTSAPSKLRFDEQTEPPSTLPPLEDNTVTNEEQPIVSDPTPGRDGVRQVKYKKPDVVKVGPKKKRTVKALHGNSSKEVVKKPNPNPNAQAPAVAEPPTVPAEVSRTDGLATPRASSSEDAGMEGGHHAVAKKGPGVVSKTNPPDAAPFEYRVSLRAVQEHGMYINPSQPNRKLAKKPSNQTLRVEIMGGKPADLASYMIITPEPSSGSDTPGPMDVDNNRHAVAGDPKDIGPIGAQASTIPGRPREAVEVHSHATTVSPISQRDEQSRPKAPEVFSRNTQDPAYAFSDEDEPTIPRKKTSDRKVDKGPASANETSETTSISNPKNTPVQKAKKRKTKKAPCTVDQVVSRARSPSLGIESSERIDSHMVVSEVYSSQPADQQIVPHLAIKEGEDTGIQAPARPKETRKVESRRNLLVESNDTPAIPILVVDQRIAVPEPTISRKRKQGHADKAQLEDFPISTTVVRLDPRSVGLQEDWEIPETPEPSPPSSPAQLSPSLGLASPSPGPQFSNDEPTLPCAQRLPSPDQTVDEPDPQEPTITVITSPTPKTPAPKNTLRRLSRLNPTSSACTGILSLLSDDEDELSLGPEDFTPSGSRRRKPSPTAQDDNSNITPNPQTHSSRRIRLSLASSGGMSSARKKASHSSKRGVVLGPRHSVGGSATKTPMRTPPIKGRFGSTLLSRLTAGRMSTLAIRSGGGGLRLGDGGTPVSPASRLGSELIQTPGGHMRRCGEGDFRCDRDFCFVCL
ncbi:hypothetical protein B0H67DRAFT_638923 [Lasiosphaeris hirsuta]|uniref:Myb-like DNA-binding domain protein n=1 Tax=Lasiosphaeris hirsuta TaxID=260670 RepID=A0AA40E821_9PEZI|nr:hypothetical protein B0H67DRAFT_638923 [Lasiosphaeris hirsuta]